MPLSTRKVRQVSDLQKFGITASEATDAPWITDVGHPQVHEQDKGEWCFAVDAEKAFEAGVQAERERIEARMKAMREETKNFTRSVTLDAALAVVTGKEGASDEG